jgi:hypothetical protein
MNIQSIKDSNWLRLTPFLVVSVILISTWVTFSLGYYNAVAKHYIALAILAVNLFVYVFKFKWGVVLTGIMLFLAAFNVISFFYYVSSGWFNIGSFQFPPVNGYSFLILIYYLIINFNFLKENIFTNRNANE